MAEYSKESKGKPTTKEAESKIDKLQDQEGLLDPQPRINIGYNPSKRRRNIRRQVYSRWYDVKDNSLRVEQEADWEIGDKEFGMVVPEREIADDWHSDLHLPDAFAAIQSQSQETVERKARPHLLKTEESDEPKAEFCNSILTYNMNNTGFDYQYYLAKLSASIRGTAFLMDYWRTEKRTVRIPVGLNDDGTIKYEAQEITDFDDDYTEWVPNEYIHIDERAKDISEAIDGFKREIINIEEFHRKYGSNPDYFDTEYVTAGGDFDDRSWFKMPRDVTSQEVEVLHYYNRSVDAYWVVANNCVIRDTPLPTKHKELPFIPVYQYRRPGSLWGMGIPKVIHYLSEERKSIRNLNMDRQKMHLNKMFLHNNSFDIDDEDLVTRPHGLISVDTNGQDVRQSIVPLEYGDVPASYFRTEEILLEDIRRAHGIDDRIQGVQAGGTATEAAILKESSMKRINLISITNEMDSLVRIGRIKWSNIQMFYGVPRMDKITKDNKTREEKVYKKVSVQGRKFSIADDGKGGKKLQMEDIQDASALALKPEYNKYLEGDFDISVDSEVFAPVSKAIEQTKKTELFGMFMSNPELSAKLDIDGAMSDVMKVNNIKPSVWMKTGSKSMEEWMAEAEAENMVMAAGQPLSGTEGAPEMHTLVHLMYTKSRDYEDLSGEIKGLFMQHIMEEHDNNPNTSSAQDMLGGGEGAPPVPGQDPNAPQLPPELAAGGPGVPPPGPAPTIQANAPNQPQAQVADLQPTNFSNRASSHPAPKKK